MADSPAKYSHDFVTSPDFEPPRAKWRFKRRKLSHDSGDESIPTEAKNGARSEFDRKKHRHHHRHGRRKKDTSGKDDGARNPTQQEQGIDPDTAFRESLFDAMADDEGAAFWEGVYGQPIHVYPDSKELPDGEREKMSDEEYVAWVRHKMWEKTHEGILEEHREREARARSAQKARTKTAQMESDRENFNRQIEESLKRADARKRQKKWQESWNAYERAWEHINKQVQPGDEHHIAGDVEIPWPVLSGRMTDVSKEGVEAFLRQGSPRGADGKVDLKAILKLERVRFHPDKVQHRFGGQTLGKEELKTVTAVFQIVDSMWSQIRQS